jgi:hypothetical protein
MFKRSFPVWFLLTLLVTLPVLAFDFNYSRTDGGHVFGTSIGQQSSNQAYSIHDLFTDPNQSNYALFWNSELQENGGMTSPPFGDNPPTAPIKDTRPQDNQIPWDLWKVVTSKTLPPPRPTFTPQVPQGWSPVVVDLDGSGDFADHFLVSASLEPTPANDPTNVYNREQILNAYYPQTARGLPGNNPDTNVVGSQDRGTVRPFWFRPGTATSPAGPGLRIRDLKPLQPTAGFADVNTGVITQPLIFARVPAVYTDGTSTFSEILPVVYMVVGTGENAEYSWVICLSLRKPITERTTANEQTWLPDFNNPPVLGGTIPPPDPNYFDPNTGTGGAVMWAYRVEARTVGNLPVPVAGVSFANIGDTNDSRPVLYVTTKDGQLICLNAKAADIRDVTVDGDPPIVPTKPVERWKWLSPVVTPPVGLPENPGFAYGMAPAVCRVPLAQSFSSNTNAESGNTVLHALQHGVSEWAVYAADTYGIFHCFEAPGLAVTDPTTMKLTRYDPNERWKDAPVGGGPRLDPLGNRERFIVPPLVYQGGTPLRTSNGAIVNGSADVGFDDEVIFSSEKGSLCALDCQGRFNVSSTDPAVDGTPTGTTDFRWKWPTDDNGFNPAAEEPQVWPRTLDPDATVNPIQRDGSYFSRGPLTSSLGPRTDPNSANPDLNPGDDLIFVPFMQEQGASFTTREVPTPRTLTRPAGYNWFYEYLGSMKPYPFVQASRPILELKSATVTVGGQTVTIPLNRMRVGLVKSNGLSVNQIKTFPGNVANAYYDPAGPAPDDTVYITDQSWYDDASKSWFTLPMRAPGGTSYQITINYVPPVSPTNNNAGAQVSETLDFPSCYRAVATDLTGTVPVNLADPATFTVQHNRASLSVATNRLEQRRVRREQTGPTPPKGTVILVVDENPALVATTDFIIDANPLALPPSPGAEGWRQPASLAIPSANASGTLMAPALFRGRIIAFDNRLRVQRVILGNYHPALQIQTRPDPALYGPPNHYGPPMPAGTPPELLNTYDPGEFFPDTDPPFGPADGSAVNPEDRPFLEDEVAATDVGNSVTLVDGWMYVTYRNGHVRAYSNVGGGASGATGGYPPLFQLPAPPTNGNLVEAPVGISFLTDTAGGKPVPTLTLDQVVDSTTTPPSIKPSAKQLHSLVGLDRSVMLEWGQTLFVAVDYGKWSLRRPAQSIDPNDGNQDIDDQIFQPGNEVQGQIRSTNGAVQQLPGVNRGVLPVQMTVPWDTTEPHAVAVVPVFCGVPAPSNPLTPGTPVLWERNPSDANPYNTFNNELLYDVQITQQGVQWRWPDNMTTGVSNGNPAPTKQHYWEIERNTGATRFATTGGGTSAAANWSWTGDKREWAPLLTYNNPLGVYYDPDGDGPAGGMILNGGTPASTVTRIMEYTNVTDSGRKNGDPYDSYTDGSNTIPGDTVAGSRSGSGRPVVPTVGVAIRKPQGASQPWGQQIIFADHGKSSPVSTTLFPEQGKLRTFDRSYMGYLGRSLSVRVQRSQLTKMGKGADYATRYDNTLYNLGASTAPQGPVGSFEQNTGAFDDAPDGLYPSLPESQLVVTKLGTSLDLANSSVQIPGRDPNRRADPDQGLPRLAYQAGTANVTLDEMESLGVSVDVPLYTADDLYSTRWRSSTAGGSNPATAFNPFFPFPNIYGANDGGRPLWDRAERWSRGPDPTDPNETAALNTRGEDRISTYDPNQNDRTRRVVLFNDANGNGQLDLLPNYREAYRTFAVQVMVKPEMKLQAHDTSLDFGNLWHGHHGPGTSATTGNAVDEIREWQQLQADKAAGGTRASIAAFREQYWKSFAIDNTGNVNLAYVKPELVYQLVGPPSSLALIAFPSLGNDPWRALPLLWSPSGLTDPYQIFLRTSFDDQLLPDASVAYGGSPSPGSPQARGVWLQKAQPGSEKPGSVLYADPTPGGSRSALERDPFNMDRNKRGVARETRISLNLPTGAPMGVYSGTLRFYNDRSVAFKEELNNPSDATTATVGFRYTHAQNINTGRNGTLDRLNTGEPIEPYTDPPFSVQAKVTENMIHGRTTYDQSGNPVPDDRQVRRADPTAAPDISFSSQAGQVRRLMLFYSSNTQGVTGGQPTMNDIFGTQLLFDSTRALFPFDDLPLDRPPWADFMNAATAGFTPFTSVSGLGFGAKASRPSVTQDARDTNFTGFLAYTQERSAAQTTGQNAGEYGIIYQQVTPPAQNGGGYPPILLAPGGQFPDLRVPRSGVRMAPVRTTPTGTPSWLAIYTLGPTSHRTLDFTYTTDPFTTTTINAPGWPQKAATKWSPEIALPGGKSLSTVSDPHVFATDAFPREPAPLTGVAGEPSYITAENTNLPASAWVSYTGTNQRLARTDIYLSRYRTADLIAPTQVGATDPLGSTKDYGQVRFARMERDVLKANATRTLYVSGGADWLVQPYSPVQLWLGRADIAPGSPGSTTNPVSLVDDSYQATLAPTGELVFELATASHPLSANTPTRNLRAALPNARILVDKAAGTVRLTLDARTLAAVATGSALGTGVADPILYGDYTPATLRLTRGDVSASDPIVVPTMMEYSGGNVSPVYDASFYRQQIDGTKWQDGTPVAGRADRLWVFWRRAAGAKAGAAGPACYYKVLRPGVRVNDQHISGIRTNQLKVFIGGQVTPEEVNAEEGLIFFPYSAEGQRVTVQYLGLNGQARQEDHIVSWQEEAHEQQVPMETSVNEGSLDAFASYENVAMSTLGGTGTAPVRHLERNWLFWSTARGSGGDLYYAAIAPRLGQEVNVNGSVTLFSGSAPRMAGLSPAQRQQRLAAVAAYEKRRPFTLPPILRRGPYLVPGAATGTRPAASR